MDFKQINVQNLFYFFTPGKLYNTFVTISKSRPSWPLFFQKNSSWSSWNLFLAIDYRSRVKTYISRSSLSMTFTPVFIANKERLGFPIFIIANGHKIKILGNV